MKRVQGLKSCTQGRFRFIWDKTTIKDDWSSSDGPRPRVQLNGLLILSDIGERGSRTHVYKADRDAQFVLPTVEGVDFANLGLCETLNDVSEGVLHVSTFEATAALHDQAARRKVTQLPDTWTAQVYREGVKYTNWRTIDEHSIQINSPIGALRFRINARDASWTAAKENRVKSTPGSTAALTNGTETPTETSAQYCPTAPSS